MRSDRPARGGYSLVELVLVLAIIAVAAAIAVPRYTASLSTYRAAAAARRVATDLELARATARARGAAVVIAFDAGAHRYELVGLDHPDRPGQPYVVELDEPPYEAALADVDFGAGATLTFDGYGSADRAGTVVVTAGGAVRSVAVAAGGGRATWE